MKLLDKLMYFFGYVREEHLNQLGAELRTQYAYSGNADKEIIRLKDENKTFRTFKEISIEEIESLQDSLDKANQEIINITQKYKEKINNLQDSLRKARRNIDSKLRKNKVLKAELDEAKADISCMIAENHYMNQKIKGLESYNYAVISRLEYLCFGSILPRVMKQIDLEYYMYPQKRLVKYFEETKAGFSAYVNLED